jgi:hypothetical protein
MQSLPLAAARRPFTFDGAISVIEAPGGSAKPVRYAHRDAELFSVSPAEAGLGSLLGQLSDDDVLCITMQSPYNLLKTSSSLLQAETCSGVRIRMRTSATKLSLTFTPTTVLQMCDFDLRVEEAPVGSKVCAPHAVHRRAL